MSLKHVAPASKSSQIPLIEPLFSEVTCVIAWVKMEYAAFTPVLACASATFEIRVGIVYSEINPNMARTIITSQSVNAFFTEFMDNFLKLLCLIWNENILPTCFYIFKVNIPY